MNRYFVLFITLLALAAISSQSTLLSQEIQDPETEYSRIRAMAFEGEYDAAVVAARRLVNLYPSYGDARVLLGRIMAWQNDFVNAIAVLDTLLKTEPDNGDALSAKSDILLWARENTKVSTDLRAGYSFDSFTEPYNRSYQLYRVGAGHRFKFGPAAASINAGNLVSGNPLASNGTEFQIEVEAYPKLSKKNYAFLNYAFSPGEFLPRHRAIAEIWQMLPAGWGVSAGMHYYYFDRSSYIATASIEKYLGNFWMSLKGFFFFKDEAITTSAYFNVRSYFTDNDYLQVTLGAGTAPDEPFEIQADLMRFLAYSARAAFNVSIAPKMVMRIGAGYSIEEYAEESWRNRFEGGISFIYAIKMK